MEDVCAGNCRYRLTESRRYSEIWLQSVVSGEKDKGFHLSSWVFFFWQITDQTLGLLDTAMMLRTERLRENHPLVQFERSLVAGTIVFTALVLCLLRSTTQNKSRGSQRTFFIWETPVRITQHIFALWKIYIQTKHRDFLHKTKQNTKHREHFRSGDKHL